MRQILLIIAIGILGVSCANMVKETDNKRVIASAIDTPLIRDCIANLDEELDPAIISKKFEVQVSGNQKDWRLSADASNLCISKIKAFGSGCTPPIITYDGVHQGNHRYTALTTPSIDERFLKNYRKHILCNRLAICEQKASLDDNTNTNVLDKIHRVYLNFKCDSIEVDAVAAKSEIVKHNGPVLEPDPSIEVDKKEAENDSRDEVRRKTSSSNYACAAANTNEHACQRLAFCKWEQGSAGSCIARPGGTSYACAPANTNPEACKRLSFCEWRQGTAGSCIAR